MGALHFLLGVLQLQSSWILLVSTFIFAVIYQCILKHWNYFSKKNVKFYRGLPFLGSQYKMLLNKESLCESFHELYCKFPTERFIGMYEVLGSPSYLIRDPELIKLITIKDFDHFVNHRMQVDETIDPLLGRTVFAMKDTSWRDMRSTLSPTFTGNKMRLMLSLINESAKDFCEELRELITDKTEGTVFDFRDLSSRYACDTIASTAFGLKISSLKEKENDFYVKGMEVANFDRTKTIKFLGFQSAPNVMNFLKIKFFTPEQSDYFRKLVHSNMQHREENNILRNDMINLLMEVKNGILNNSTITDDEKYKNIGFATVQESEIGKKYTRTIWEDDDYVAQCVLFFLAGFSAVSLGQCFMAHELSINPNVQECLYQEIVVANNALEGKTLTYDALQKMKYMDMVVSETLRRWSLGAALERRCNKPYVMENYDGNQVHLDVGDSVWIPLYSMHMDPEYFPNPKKFDPERFNDENKHNIRSGTYIPFGIGPRNCVASRFALMEIKSLFFYMLLNFELVKCSKTQDPIVLKPGTISTEPTEGFFTMLRPRH